jgi:hypothetical protein
MAYLAMTWTLQPQHRQGSLLLLWLLTDTLLWCPVIGRFYCLCFFRGMCLRRNIRFSYCSKVQCTLPRQFSTAATSPF